MAVVIPAEREQPLREVAPKNGTNFTLEELYTLISCDTIDILPLPNGQIMVIDDEGKLVGKPRNEQATRLVDFATPKQMVDYLLRLRDAGIEVFRAGEPLSDISEEVDWIAGDVLICDDTEVQ